MSTKPIAVLILSAMTLAACQPEGTMDAVSGLLDDDAFVQPAGEFLAASCTGDPELQQQLAEAVNAAREAEGKLVLDGDERLTEIAQLQACDAAAMGQLTVTGSDGSNVVDRARRAGYRPCEAAQLLAIGGSPAEVVGDWLRSEPHRDEILGQISLEIGTGVTRGADGQLWWSVVLGNNCRKPWRESPNAAPAAKVK
ncbi:CAP domain-containing protein [Paracoccus marinaquae]|uniref:CAP domain-containing protein n=1 Tax=Paracoccus marinaquae TaxID=2841926 RepID=A0ABS6AMH3_9RHOB|nr:CAP domain-containing protein [Paracoccus marinaquae]MBU3031803.1 CAP domain-containing protein [Paracoccus marinaquae]